MQARSATQLSQCDGARTPGGCLLLPLRRMHYADALDLQKQLHTKVTDGSLPGALLLVEHDPVVTLGVKTAHASTSTDPAALATAGIELLPTDRGGEATYHGPGQLVGYPILRLREIGADLHAYLRSLEDCIIQTLGGFGLTGRRNGPAGVWVDDRKICSIGIAVRKWVTYHGFALNVDPDMSHFHYIHPCGLDPDTMTSMAMLLGSAPSMEDVAAACAAAFSSVFGLNLQPATDDIC